MYEYFELCDKLIVNRKKTSYWHEIVSEKEGFWFLINSFTNGN